MSEKVIFFDRVHIIITNRAGTRGGAFRGKSRGRIWYNTQKIIDNVKVA